MLNRFAQLSASEKRLSIAVAVLLCAAIIMLIAFRCVDALSTLDATIASQESALLEFSKFAGLAGPVDKAYDAMAKQHSSEWTQEQIHDRLRVEIARLSLRQTPPEDTPIPAVSKPGDLLVDIRSWPVGALDDSGEGYRTYQIKFHAEPTAIQNVAMFLERLQQSPQALRVDYLELTRQPLSTAVTADVRVTRTVIGEGASPQPKVAEAVKPAAPTNLVVNADFAQWDPQDSSAPGWTATNASLAAEKDLVADGDTALSVHANGANAELYQTLHLRAGTTYEIGFVAKASGPAQLRIFNESTGSPLRGDAALVPSPVGQRYRYRFTVPGDKGAEVTMRAPSFVIEQSGAVLVVGSISLQEIGV